MTEYTIRENNAPKNSIIFYNGGSADPSNEVMRISSAGVTANPNVPVDEAADAVLRALDGYIKGMVERTKAEERERIASQIDRMPFGDTAHSFAVWIRAGAP